MYFIKSIKGNNGNSVTDEQIKILTSYREQDVLLNGTSNNSTISRAPQVTNETSTLPQMRSEDNESVTKENGRSSHCQLEYDKFDLPNDYQKVMDMFEDIINEANLQLFQMNEVIEAMDIDAIYKKLKEGHLEYWKAEGEIKYILAPFERYDFSDVSAFAVHLAGDFTLSQSEAIKQFLRKVSNDNVIVLTSLCFKEKAAGIKMILLVHRNETKATEQRLDVEHDGTRIYKRKQKL